MYGNTAQMIRNLEDLFDLWLDYNCPFPGDIILATTGMIKVELKLETVKLLTTKSPNNLKLARNNYFPRASFATISSIGTGLNSSNVYQIICFGISSNILNLAQVCYF